MTRARAVLAASIAAGVIVAGAAPAAAAGPGPPPNPLVPIVEGLLTVVGDAVGGVTDTLDGPEPAASPAAPAAPTQAPAPPPPAAALPAPAPPAGVDPAGDTTAREPAPTTSEPAADGDSDGDSAFLPARLGNAVASKTNLLLLALGLGVALLGATPRLPAHRRARREVLTGLADACDRQRRAAQELAVADQSKAEFLGLVSHELRAPLATMKGSVDTVLVDWHDLPEPQRRELLVQASGNADELARLVGQLLAFARIDGGRIDVDVRELSVRDAVTETIEGVEGILAGHPVEVDVPGALVMRADAETFAHVVGGLVTSAAKCSSDGAPVRVAARGGGAEVEVSVMTTAVGANSNGGSDIGLAVARRFAEVQGGRLSVERAKRGSTCSFTVPAVPTRPTVPPAQRR